jgi:hypothetical protein
MHWLTEGNNTLLDEGKKQETKDPSLFCNYIQEEIQRRHWKLKLCKSMKLSFVQQNT